MPLRLVFMGTPDFAVPTLSRIIESGHDVCAVVTRAPKPAGRGMAQQASPVERAARAHDIPVLTPKTLRSDAAVAEFRAHRADAAVVVAYGLILPAPVLAAPRLGCFNLHASLLPRWRGAAPIHRAIMAGDPVSGITVMRMEEGLDTGPIVRRKRVPVGPDMTAGELHDALASRGAELIVDALDALERKTLRITQQSTEGVTYAAKIGKAETRIDWARPGRTVHDHCRGLSPFPGAWFELAADGRPARIKVLRTTGGEGSGAPGTVLDDRFTVACGEGAVRILALQRAGARAMPAAEFLRGTPLAPGTRLG